MAPFAQASDLLNKLAAWSREYPKAVAGDHAGEALIDLARQAENVVRKAAHEIHDAK